MFGHLPGLPHINNEGFYDVVLEKRGGNCPPSPPWLRHSGDMGLETLKSSRDKAKLKWWYKLATMPQDRYPKQLFSQEWNVKPRRGRERKTWSKVIDDIFLSLGLDKCECSEDIEREDSSLAAFMSCIEGCISERECRKFEEGLNNKVKLAMYKTFGKNVEFKSTCME